MSATSEVRAFFQKVMKEISSVENMRALGAFSIRTIQNRTRGQGKGVSRPGGQATKLKRVTPEYADRRSRMKSKHPEASTGAASNLTLFGPLLSSLIIKRATKTQLEIGHRMIREDKKTEGQERQGRRYLVLSGAEMKQAEKFLANLIAGKIG